MIYSAKQTLIRFLTSICLILLPVLATAQTDDVVVGFSDHSLIDGFPNSEIISRTLQRDINYRIVLGGLERVRGEVIPEASERLRGDVTKIIYEVSQEFTGEDVYQFFQEQFTNKNYEVLFDCAGRECGSSNYWANDIFRNRILYGPVRNQYFTATRANSELDGAPYFSLYIITRVNRRIYAYIEIVEPGGTQDPEQIAAIVEVEEPPVSAPNSAPGSNLMPRLLEQGSLVLTGLSFQSDDSLAAGVDIEPLVTALSSDRSVSVYLVAHLKQDGQSLQELMRRSTVRANSLRQALIAAGIGAQRIEAAGIGPLAPNCTGGNCADRIELVLQ